MGIPEPPEPGEAIKAREEDFWKAAFLQSLIGTAASSFTASALTGAAVTIANQSLQHYRKFHDNLHFEEEIK